ncbi:heterokaryon incompatibility protein-domain-containing protein [Tricladium varicosporioides]|nr:heterokaryon incompatibility protein-domain-containing protein [Hymenoscyphus varicosporioides]
MLDGGQMPTRLIDLKRKGVGSDTIRLVSTKDWKQGEHYIALSHCWGNLTELQKSSWCTSPANFKTREQEFLVSSLPATFRDAINVSQELGKRYLWIDSLCIIQGPDGDWDTEAEKMETVFRNAYCTIAATSATDSTKGFLDRPPRTSTLQYATIPNSSHGPVYISTSIDNFSSDVEEGVLNGRAWVLQERALSRRTIHFTERQTYWECGGGIRCESLTFMKNGKVSFRADPEFPNSVKADKRDNEAEIKLFQSLFEDYTSLGLSHNTDRPIAIKSLAIELAKTFETNVRYGIFECYLHRSLLWYRFQDSPMERIWDKSDIPSWSWMAYSGKIKFLQANAYESDEWDPNVQLLRNIPDEAASDSESSGFLLQARLASLYGIEVKGSGHVIRDGSGFEIGQLWFDNQQYSSSKEVLCCVVGRRKEPCTKQHYYVLLVRKGLKDGIYERIGMGSIAKCCLQFNNPDVRVRIS